MLSLNIFFLAAGNVLLCKSSPTRKGSLERKYLADWGRRTFQAIEPGFDFNIRHKAYFATFQRPFMRGDGHSKARSKASSLMKLLGDWIDRIRASNTLLRFGVMFYGVALNPGFTSWWCSNRNIVLLEMQRCARWGISGAMAHSRNTWEGVSPTAKRFSSFIPAQRRTHRHFTSG